MRNADESQKSKHDKRCAMTVATRVSSAGRASDAHRDRQVFHQKHGHMPRIPPVISLKRISKSARVSLSPVSVLGLASDSHSVTSYEETNKRIK